MCGAVSARTDGSAAVSQDEARKLQDVIRTLRDQMREIAEEARGKVRWRGVVRGCSHERESECVLAGCCCCC